MPSRHVKMVRNLAVRTSKVTVIIWVGIGANGVGKSCSFSSFKCILKFAYDIAEVTKIDDDGSGGFRRIGEIEVHFGWEVAITEMIKGAIAERQ